MSYSIRSSTKALLNIAGIESYGPIATAADESYLVHQAVVALRNKVYGQMGGDAYAVQQWVVEPAVIAALRNALADHAADYGGRSIAAFLLRTGCRHKDTIAALHPWDAIFFNWQLSGLTAARVVQLLKESRLASDVPAAIVAKITDWIRNPDAISSASFTVPFELFGDKRAIYSSLRDNGFCPSHDKLFADLVATVQPPIAIDHVKQFVDRSERFVEQTMQVNTSEQSFSRSMTVLSDDGAHWVVQYEYNGSQRAFFTQCRGTWMDVAGVVEGFAQLMSSLNRTERAFQFAFDHGENAEHGCFIAADANRFLALASQLHIPLEEAHGPRK